MLPKQNGKKKTPNAIKALRLARNLTMAQLAEQANTTTSTINRLEKGLVTLDVNWLDTFSGIFLTDWYGVAGRTPDALDNALNERKRLETDDVVRLDLGADHPMFGIALGADRGWWRVLSNALHEIGLGQGSEIMVDESTAAIDALATGDAVIIEYADEKQTGHVFMLLREYVEPDLFVTNSQVDNLEPINRKTSKVRVVGVVLNRFVSLKRTAKR